MTIIVALESSGQHETGSEQTPEVLVSELERMSLPVTQMGKLELKEM